MKNNKVILKQIKRLILKRLSQIKRQNQDKSLFYAWDELPLSIQTYFIAWCEYYMQVSHKDCFGGWVFGWSKYYEQYILWLQGKRKDLE